MYKKYIFLFLLVLLGSIATYFLGNKTFLGTTYHSNVTNIEFEIPKHSLFIKEKGLYTVYLKSYIEKDTLEKEIKDILANYKYMECSGKKVYVKENHIISEYSIAENLITRDIIIKYEPSSYCDSNYSFHFEDDTKKCNNKLETFHEDDEFYYQFPCTKSNTTFVVFDDSTKITVKEALKRKYINISDVENSFLKILKTKKD